jgi:multiple antibiotic resistance protein
VSSPQGSAGWARDIRRNIEGLTTASASTALKFVPALVLLVAHDAAEAASEMATEPAFAARKIFALLFLMLGPFKILIPFSEMTRSTGAAFRRRLATRAIRLSTAAIALAAALGSRTLEQFDPGPTLTGGVALFLVAVQRLLEQCGPPRERSAAPLEMRHAVSAPAFPTIVTPYGVSAIIIFGTLAENDRGMMLTLAGIVVLILALDWLSMLFVEAILRWCGVLLRSLASCSG